MSKRLNRVLTNDPGTGVMRHVDAGYNVVGMKNVNAPDISKV